MSDTLSILVIDDNKIRASIIEQGLREAGHGRVIVIDQMDGLVRQITDIEPDVIVIDLENPKRDQLEHIFQVSRAVQRPIAMFVDTSEPETIEAAVDAGVSAYVVDGLKKDRVKPIMDMAISRFRAFSRLNKELAAARNELAERKTIDRAKGILMRSKRISEQEAYDLLRKTAMNQSRKINDVAQSLIIASGMLGD
ncbi:ANTAR domain-containing response regulator [Cohaesibacter celericrescens]|uniref:Two-component system response regulator n=1 Tax=Cohaesibacter celericrescens TaxID=2067669 RepID=A0A2N5XXH9_9HYPH|nr:ANTAR domain-containing protein [Cohaesibacter celericrescens]PLW79189.1 two-component system response regulator [Cohaesibacter celericrescens]